MNSKELHQILDKPIWQMTGAEFCQLPLFLKEKDTPSISTSNQAVGMQALGQAIGCCSSTIYFLKKQGVLDDSIVSNIGKKIIFDVDKARALAQAYQEQQRSTRKSKNH